MFKRDRRVSTGSTTAPSQLSRTVSSQPSVNGGGGLSPPPLKEKRKSFFGLGGGSKDKTSQQQQQQAGGGRLALGRTTSSLSTNNEQYEASFTSGPTPPPQNNQHMTRDQWEAAQRQQQLDAQLRTGGGAGARQQHQPLSHDFASQSQISSSNASPAGSTPPPPPKINERQLQQQQQRQSLDLGGGRTSHSDPPPSKQLGELQFALDLIMAQPNKVYATSPPTLKSMVAAGADGKHPRAGPPGTPGNDWQEVWVELRGIILHVWNMKEVAEANARGQDKHPNRINTSDSFVDLIQPLPPTRHDPAAGPHPFVFSINTAGLNSVLFSCPNKEVMMEWVTAIRLAGYESSRLMEIYTGHLIRSVGTPLPPLSQTNNRIAGWFDVRTFGSRSWSHLWVVLSVEGPPGTNSHVSHPSLSNDPKVGAGKTKNRISKLFGGGASPPELTTTPYPPVPGESSPTGMGPGRGSEMSLASVAGGRPVVSAQFYTVPPKSTLSRSPASSGQVPFLTVTDVSQAFAVYPEVETEIDNSAMFKVEGHLAGEAMGPSSRRDEGWILMIPMEKEGELFTAGKRSDMLRWLAAFHDAFGLYGRPANYSWDARDPKSLLFAHPHGDQQDDLFIVKPDPNPEEISISRAAFVRSRFRDILVRRMNGQPPLQHAPTPAGANPSQIRQPLQGVPESPEHGSRGHTPRESIDGGQQGSVDSAGALSPTSAAAKPNNFQLPPFSFGNEEVAQAPSPSAAHSAPGAAPPPRSPLRKPSSPVPFREPPVGGSASLASPASASNQSFAQRQDQQHQQQPSDATSFTSAREQQQPSSTANGNGYGRDHSGSSKSASMQVLPGTMDVRPLRTDYQLDENESPDLVTSPESYHPPSSFGQASTAPPLAKFQQQQPFPRQQQQQSSSTSRSIPPIPQESDFGPGSDEETYGVSTVARPGAFNAFDSRSQQSASPAPPLPRVSTPPGSVGHQSTLEAPSKSSLSLSQSSHSAHLRSSEPSSSQPLSSSGFTGPIDGFSMRTPPLTSGTLEGATSPSSTSSSKREMEKLGRRPSGARAAPGRRIVSEAASTMPVFSDQEEAVPSPQNPAPAPRQLRGYEEDDHSDHNADALAAMSFLDATSPTSPVKTRALPPQPHPRVPSHREDLPPIQTSFIPPAPPPATFSAAEEQTAFPSSFGPGKSAAERRAKAEAAEQQRHDVLTKPGKGKGVVRSAKKGNNWAASSEEDEDDDDDEEGSVDSNPRRPTSSYPQQHASQSQMDLSGRGNVGLGRPLPQNPAQRNLTEGDVRRPESSYNPAQSQYDRGRQQDLQPPRPAFANGAPSSRSPSGYDQDYNNQGGQHGGQRASSYSGYGSDYQLHQPQPRPAPGGKLRSSVWTTHLESSNPHGGAAESQNTFVEVEQPTVNLTKAFNPNGLLQAGLEDKNDRSAKRQEELARESGASLVNVPSKPPPPQTGLLGAITAHERDRAREGGVGAAMTERERDRRAAEERARKIDALQREQLEAMSNQQGGSPGPYGYNPYGQQGGIMPPWGMGMPQMGGGGGGGGSAYGGYGGGMDPQMAAMMAATAAYQQAMMSYSQAGSQAGGDDNQRPPSMMPGMMGGGAPMGSPWGMPPWGMPFGGMSTYGMPSPNGGGSQMGGYLPPQQQFAAGSQSGHSPSGSFHNGHQQQAGRNGSPDQRNRLNSSTSRSPLNGNGPSSSGHGGGTRSSTPRSSSRANLN